MAVKGVFASDSSIQGDRVGDFASHLLTTQPTGSAPILALSSGMKSTDAVDTIVTWFEENHISGRLIAAGTYDADDTSIVVTDASSIPAGTTLLVEATGEMLYTTAVVGNTLTVFRGFAESAADNIASGGGIQRIGTAVEEGSGKPDAVANLGYPRFNYTQIFRNTWNVTGTARAVQYHTGSKDAKSRADAGIFHAEDIERSLIYGRKAHGVKNGQPFRTMDGLNSQITTNVSPAGGTTDYTDMLDFFQDVFAHNIKGAPNERIAFCGNSCLSVLNEIARIEGTIYLNPGQTDFGLNVSTWITPFGSLKLMTHPLMNESPLWSKDLYVYHPGAIRTRYLRRTNTDAYDKNGTRNGVDAEYGVLTTELSVEYMAEITGGRMTGFTKAAAVA